jgi:SAM-dependent methyltransferase
MPNKFVKVGHKLLSVPLCYDMFQTAVGSVRFRREFVRENIVNFDMSSVLDLGCGTASTIGLLPRNVRYIGIDSSRDYLAKAEKRSLHVEKKLIETDISDKSWLQETGEMGKTLGLALGIFHHLDDSKLIHTISNLGQVMPPSSKLVSLDPIIDEESSNLARWFAKNDRGQFIREFSEYERLFAQNNFRLTFRITRNSFRIPYDLIIMTAIKNS